MLLTLRSSTSDGYLRSYRYLPAAHIFTIILNNWFYFSNDVFHVLIQFNLLFFYLFILFFNSIQTSKDLLSVIIVNCFWAIRFTILLFLCFTEFFKNVVVSSKHFLINLVHTFSFVSPTVVCKEHVLLLLLLVPLGYSLVVVLYSHFSLH